MSEEYISPDECTTMEQVREGVDTTDGALIALLERRFGYMRAAARIKQDRSAVRDETRKAAVVAAAADRADQAGLPRAEIEAIWDQLVEASIAYEMTEWDRIRS